MRIDILAIPCKTFPMCGRAYATYTDEEIAIRYLNKKPVRFPDRKPNYNLAPTQSALVLRMLDNERRLDLMRWGLVPFWAKEIKIGSKMINARSETVSEKPAFRQAFKQRRCIVPLSGFIEWKKVGDKKHPHRISLKEEPIMSMAGLWETWKSPDGESIETFTILTTAANAFMSRIHDRMPLILPAGQEELWLDSSVAPERLVHLFNPATDTQLVAHEISTLINSPANNRPEVLEIIA